MIIITFTTAFVNNSQARKEDVQILFNSFAKFYSAGDLVTAEKILFLVLDQESTIPEEYLVATFNNLGAINTVFGRYNKALEYNSRAETLIISKNPKSQALADIYNNKAYIYNIKKSYDLAIEYLEKSIRIYLSLYDRSNESLLLSISSVYINIGITFLETKNYKSALEYFNQSAEIKSKFNISGLELVYLNIAKTFVKTKNQLKAEEFYLKSISSFKMEFGDDYYRLAEVYFEYGMFLRSAGKIVEALEAHQRALSICQKNYGEKHTLVSLSYKHLGDDYMIRDDYKTALNYYQRALISIVNDFNDPDIFANPSIDSTLLDIRLLDNLKSKSRALELISDQQNNSEVKLKTLGKSLEIIELALQLIDRIRNNYPSEESRIYLTENEKETYVFATHLAYNLYSLSPEEIKGEKMYEIAKKAKAAILRNDISGNELLWSSSIPDTLRMKQTSLAGNIAAYNNLILLEMRKKDPDNNKISLWKDAIFEMNRENERVAGEINNVFPQYRDLLRKTEPISLTEIQNQLKRDETVIDYLLSNNSVEGKRKLYTFLITKDRLEFNETLLDSLFTKNVQIIRKGDIPGTGTGNNEENFGSYTEALYYMYENLIKPAEGFFRGNKLIIIPDEEIAWLPFDAFLKSKPESYQTDYEGLSYLINDYIFSYGYSSSLIFSKDIRLKKGSEVYAFSPDYGINSISGKGLDSLRGAGEEIESIFKKFSGKKFTGNQATEKKFKEAIANTAIFHLALHALTDSTNSRYSYFVFGTDTGNLEDGKLYNYEISLSRLKSPMVVLSACSSGSGTLYQGEGLMSLARGFILAGASSVIKTAWEVNDEVSADIITGFYTYLSKGNRKDESMRRAKLDYLKKSSPSLTNPYFWAAYEVMGDNTPLARNNRNILLFIAGVILIVLTVVLINYFMRRRISSDRSL